MFTSMLGAYYDINTKDEFDELFKDTYIYDHQTNEKNGYYILRFDFSGLNTEDPEGLKNEFFERVKSNCSKFIERYGLDAFENQASSAAGYVSNLLDHLSNKIKYPIYVMIDEYDHFANELLSFTVGAHECHFDDFHNIVSKNGVTIQG